MPYGETLGDGILPLQDVNISAENSRCRDPHECIGGADIRDILIVQYDPAGLDESSGFHPRHVQRAWMGAEVEPVDTATIGASSENGLSSS